MKFIIHENKYTFLFVLINKMYYICFIDIKYIIYGRKCDTARQN